LAEPAPNLEVAIVQRRGRIGEGALHGVRCRTEPWGRFSMRADIGELT
jgi:hypothetical protein